MMDIRNMLREVECESFNVRNERAILDEIAEEMRADSDALDAIPDYVGDSSPSADDIMAAERVLKYISQREGVGFTRDDALLVMRYTTNVLRWSQNMPRRSG